MFNNCFTFMLLPHVILSDLGISWGNSRWYGWSSLQVVRFLWGFVPMFASFVFSFCCSGFCCLYCNLVSAYLQALRGFLCTSFHLLYLCFTTDSCYVCTYIWLRKVIKQMNETKLLMEFNWKILMELLVYFFHFFIEYNEIKILMDLLVKLYWNLTEQILMKSLVKVLLEFNWKKS